MSKLNLKVITPVGEFTRSTNTKYSHAVVRNSPRAMAAFQLHQAAGSRRLTGVSARWIKDRGFAVTWHGSEAAALKAAAGKYLWDNSQDVVGVYEVQA